MQVGTAVLPEAKIAPQSANSLTCEFVVIDPFNGGDDHG
jgi:hypothetical protein